MPTPTIKQQIFVKEYVRTNGNGTQAALKAYDTTDPNTAHAIANENLQKPTVQQILDKELQHGKLKLENITNKLTDIIGSEPAKGYSGADIVEAVKTGLKLHGVLTERKQVTSFNMNADLSKLSKYELIERHRKMQQETEAIINGEVEEEATT